MPNCYLCHSLIASRWGKKFCSIKCSAKHASIIGADLKRKDWRTGCLQCGVEFVARDSSNIFCSQSCSATHSNIRRARPKLLCANQCGKPVPENARRCCSKRCAGEFTRSETIRKWKNGERLGSMENREDLICKTVRDYVLKKFSNKCSICEWSKIHPITGKVPLQVHHKNGDSSDSCEENLEVLCPNCHSLTLTYGSLNVGKGRKKRHLKSSGGSYADDSDGISKRQYADGHLAAAG